MVKPLDVADYLRLLREAQGVSQSLLAEVAGLTRSTITKMEKGTHALSVESLAKIADALGYEVDVRFVKRPGD